MRAIYNYLQLVISFSAAIAFVTERACDFESVENMYCGWTVKVGEGEGSYGLTRAAASAGTNEHHPLVDFKPGNKNGMFTIVHQASTNCTCSSNCYLQI